LIPFYLVSIEGYVSELHNNPPDFCLPVCLFLSVCLTDPLSVCLIACFVSIEGYVCELHNNPPDFFLDVVNGDSSAVQPIELNAAAHPGTA